ncbi:hypothetical protein BUALT_Bualt18G0057800 [Buddleja alternifolia]|uniref:non-specific serine/threonine protein kinase n=1 Tax=Buddleja alternifolia TaxID=168488 RepID=A0AAV6WD49_9LAMI|nr:hypothetical protein BUALT_Bualt18G0057800 [Buddleja alternifolia]
MQYQSPESDLPPPDLDLPPPDSDLPPPDSDPKRPAQDRYCRQDLSDDPHSASIGTSDKSSTTDMPLFFSTCSSPPSSTVLARCVCPVVVVINPDVKVSCGGAALTEEEEENEYHHHATDDRKDTLFPNQTIINGQTLISQSQIFELGFFSPGASRNRFLGIWYKSTPDVVVWVANRNNPITVSGVDVILSIARNGTLVISTPGSIIWSQNSSGVPSSSNPVLQLLDTGNLVVSDRTGETSPESYIWQSFDYPSDTRLPGMYMVDNTDTGQEKYLTSWRNPDDPSPGDFIYKIENQGLPDLVILRGEMKRYRTGHWNGLYWSGSPVTNPGFQSIATFKNDIITSLLEHYNSSTITRTAMEPSGFVQRYSMNERRDKWNLVYTVPRDPCDNYAQCGPYGVCSVDKEPICECLKGFAAGGQRDWDWSGGCTRIRPLNCKNGDGFREVKDVKFPDMLKFWLNTSMTLGECRGECLKNCNCTAYANPYITDGGKGCLMWFGDLIDIREIQGADSRQIIYIRLPVSELESDNNLEEEEKKKKPGRLILILAAAGVLAWLLWKENKALELMDACMNDACVESQVKRCIQVGLLCVQKFVEKRPVMSSVLFMLANEEAILPEPREPGFFTETSSSSNEEDHISTREESKKDSMTISDLEAR